MYQMIQDTLSSSFPALLAFVRTCELGNFSRAASALHVTPAAVSRAVARLEHSLGVRLFQRSTRAFVMTQEGQQYFETCAQALLMLSEARVQVAHRGEIRGRVRLSVPSTFGLHVLASHLGHLRKRHPQLELELHISNESVDFVREGFDLAIRMGHIEDASLVARKLQDCSVGVFASPDYLGEHPGLKTPRDLNRHQCVTFVLPKSGRLLPWIFTDSPDFTPKNSLKILGDPLGLIAAGVGGAGVFQGYHFLVERELKAKRLKEVLKNFSGRTRKFSLVHLKDATRVPAVKAVADWILKVARP
jgi:DNA-binding transcriptional LysR family regulator